MRRFVCLMFVLCGFWGAQNSWAAGDGEISCSDWCNNEQTVDIYNDCMQGFQNLTRCTDGFEFCFVGDGTGHTNVTQFDKSDIRYKCKVITPQCTITVLYYAGSCKNLVKRQTKNGKSVDLVIVSPSFQDLEDNFCDGFKPDDDTILAGWCTELGCDSPQYVNGVTTLHCTGTAGTQNIEYEYKLYPYFKACDGGYKMAKDRMSCEPLVYSLKLDSQGAATPGTTQVFYKYQQADPCYYYTDYDCTSCIAGDKGNKITIPTRSGYTFNGYWTQADGKGDKYIDATGTFIKNAYSVFAPTDGDSTTLYAHWMGNPYTVTLDLATGMSPSQVVIKNSDTWTKQFYYYFNTKTDGCVYYSENSGGVLSNCLHFEVPVRQGYTFGGYYTAENGAGIQYIDADGNISDNLYTKISKDTTLYAKWTANVYNVTYSCGCDGVTGCSGTPPPSVQVTYDTYFTVASAAPDCRFDGSIFEGWKVSKTDNVLVAGNKYLWTYPEDKTISVKWKMCPKGYYCPNKDQQKECPIGATSDEGAKAVTDCYLKGGGTSVCSGYTCYTLPTDMKNVFFTGSL